MRAAALCLGLLLAAAPAAQPVSLADRDDRELFLLGKASADAGDFERALAYLTAYALRRPTPGALTTNGEHRAQVHNAIQAFTEVLRFRQTKIAQLEEEIVALGGAKTIGMLHLPPLDVPDEFEGGPPVVPPDPPVFRPLPRPGLEVLARPSLQAFQEDCLPFDVGALDLVADGGRWVLTDGASRMMAFDDEAEGRRTLAILRRYRADRHCFVGRPDPSLTYVLVGTEAPEGALPSEDCVRFDPAALRLEDLGRWTLTQGDRRLMAFPSRAEGEQALAIVRGRGVTHTCYVGRPDPSFTYLRR